MHHFLLPECIVLAVQIIPNLTEVLRKSLFLMGLRRTAVCFFGGWHIECIQGREPRGTHSNPFVE